MSAISTYLEYIRSKIYAKDVRTAIVNAISQCYDDVNAPALQTEAMQAAVQAKIDAGQMAALTIGDGTITAKKFAEGVIDNTLSQEGSAAESKIVGNYIDGLKKGSKFLNKNDADYNLRVKAGTTKAEEDPDGTRIRIIYKVDVPFVLTAVCNAGSGLSIALYDTLSKAVTAYAGDAIESYTDGYSKDFINISSNNIGYLSISQSNPQNVKITDAMRKEYFDALNLSLEYSGYHRTELEDIKKSISDITPFNVKRLYIGDFMQKRIIPSGYAADSDPLTNYRISSANTLVLPCGSNKKIYGKIGKDYAVSLMSGATATNLKHNQYWFTGKFEITIPDGDVYYRISVTNAEPGTGGTRHDAIQIVPDEDIQLELYYDDFGIVNANEEDKKILSAAMLNFSKTNPNSLRDFPVIAHTSDCHGDYERVKNFIDTCDRIGVDAACITGDIVAYKPEHGLKWFFELVNNAKSLISICTGNHDVYDTNMTDTDIYDFMFASIADKIGNTTGETWYYKDLSNKKIRVISVNLYQHGGESRWYTHFTNDQLAWLVNALSTTPSGYGVIILSHAAQVSLEGAKDQDHGAFFQNVRKYNSPHNSVSGGVPLYDIVDAFISRTTLSKDYTQTGTPSSISVSADFRAVDNSIEFIAHLTGHFHQDSICYVPGTTQKQLMLNVTCTTSAYGGAEYPYLADISDLGRNYMDATQDAYNVYVIDRANKNIKVVRIGSNITYDMRERKYMSIPYAD